jgi:hypothetical protein
MFGSPPRGPGALDTVFWSVIDDQVSSDSSLISAGLESFDDMVGLVHLTNR